MTAPTDWKAKCDAFVENYCGPLRTYEGGSSRASRHQGTANELHALVLDAQREALERAEQVALAHAVTLRRKPMPMVDTATNEVACAVAEAIAENIRALTPTEEPEHG